MRQRIVASVLTLLSIVVSLAAMEIATRIISNNQTQQIAKIPEEWARKPTVVPGARIAYYWHGALHVEDKNAFRRTTPIVADEAAFRILVIGDSLTYGSGVADEATYSSVIASELSKRGFRVQVTNLGVQGAQSEDILRILRTNIEVARPHLVIYGICLNDFLASGHGQEEGINVPRRLQWSALAALTVRSLNQAGMKLGIFRDFAGQIREDLPRLEPRFRNDLAAMNRLVTERGLPPVVTMVLDQYPSLNGPMHDLALVAERAAESADMDVIPTDEYYRKYDGRALNVSNWEGHPNVEAHGIFARMFLSHIAGCCGMEKYSVAAIPSAN
jgi:lysophospholipase L1-like esterase